MATKKQGTPKVTDTSVSIQDQPAPAKTKSGQTFALTPDNIFKAWENAETYTDILNQPFPEFQRVAEAQPYAGLAKKFPRIAEGSTASYVEQKPRQLIQQSPTGNVTAELSDPTDLPKGWTLEAFSLVAQWMLDFEIIPHATEDYPVFEKAQNGLEQALTVGCTVTTAPFYNHDGIWSADMTMIFWGDVKVPAGYKAINPMPYTFIEGWWPPERVNSLMNDPNAAAGGWNLKALKDSKDTLSSKDYKSETPVEKARGLPEDYYRVVIAHQVGVKAPIYTFNPDTKSIIRTKLNPDPRGHKNIQTLYGKTDGTNPFGVSIFERGVGAWQNLMDNDVQAYQYNRAYNVDPALKRMGSIGDGELRPGASFTAQSAEDDIVTIDIGTSALDNFPSLYEWQRGVLMSRLTAPTSASGTNGESPLGKTPQGIQSANSLISTDDLTYVTHTHNWFQEWAETAINITFAERKGKQTLELDDNTADQLRALSQQDPAKFDATLLKDNTLVFDFNQKLPIFRFKVDAASSKVQDEAAQLQALESINQSIEGNSTLQELTGPVMVAKIYNKMVAISGVHDASDLEIDIKALEEQIKEEDAQQGASQSEQARIAETAKAPGGAIAYKDMQPFGQLQMAAMANIKLRPQDVGLNADFSPLPAPPTDPNTIPAKLPKGQVAAPIVAPSAQPTPTNVANPPANPQVPKEIIQAAMTLQQHGLPEVLIPHAIQALSEGVPLSAILQSISSPAVASLKRKVNRRVRRPTAA